jgi:hypothetical protein
VHPVAVVLAGSDLVDVPVPDQVAPLRELIGLQLHALRVQQDEVNGLGVLREEAEVGALTIPRRPQGGVATGPGHELLSLFRGRAKAGQSYLH